VQAEPRDLDDALPLSGLQHLAFCPRQWALIHLEQAWAENRLTAEGRLLHERADLPGGSRRHTVRTVRGLLLHSPRLRLIGRADIVEFRPQPFPVEYKRGKRKPTDCDLVQLCAQALCLEEMLATPVPQGAIFYGESRRRIDVEFTAALRSRTETLAITMHRLYAAHETPPALPATHCDRCSLIHVCLPNGTQRVQVAERCMLCSSAFAAGTGSLIDRAQTAQYAARHDPGCLPASRWRDGVHQNRRRAEAAHPGAHARRAGLLGAGFVLAAGAGAVLRRVSASRSLRSRGDFSHVCRARFRQCAAAPAVVSHGGRWGAVTCTVRTIVTAKVVNSRIVLLRGAREIGDSARQAALRAAADRLSRIGLDASRAASIDEARGHEGAAGQVYFSVLAN